MISDRVSLLMSRIEEQSEKLEALGQEASSRIASGTDRFEIQCFRTLLIHQGCLDIAELLSAEEAWHPRPETAEWLGRSAKLCDGLVRARVDPEEVRRAAIEGPADVEKFMAEVSHWLLGRREE